MTKKSVEIKDLAKKISKYYNIDELKSLTFVLDIDWDELAGENKSSKVQQLILYIGKENRLQDLLNQLRKERPTILWPGDSFPDSQVFIVREAFGIDRRSKESEHIISNLYNSRIKSILEAAYNETGRLEIALLYDQSKLTRPIQYWEGHVPNKNISVEESLKDLFVHNERSLLILGGPGSGKTFKMLELCRDLLLEALDNINAQIPIIIELSKWEKTNESFNKWITNQIHQEYQTAQRISQKWLEENQVCLLLDGLDEVNSSSRDECAIAINEFQKEYSTPLVICCRTKEYEELAEKLNVSASIVIQPLTDAQVESYLKDSQLELDAIHKAVQEDESLRAMSKTPLMLSIMAIAYRGDTVDALQPALMDFGQRRSQIFDAYIKRMFSRKSLNGDREKIHLALVQLSFLAGQLSARNEYQFYIENLQADWLSTLENRRYRILHGLTFGLLLGLLAGLLFGIGEWLFYGSEFDVRSSLMLTLSTVLFYGALQGMGNNIIIEPVELLIWNSHPSRKDIWEWLTSAVGAGLGIGVGIILGGGALGGIVSFLIIGLIISLGNGLVVGLGMGVFIGALLWLVNPVGILENNILEGLVWGLGSMLVLGFIQGLSVFLETAPSQKRLYPNQGIILSGKNAVRIGIVIFLVGGESVGLIIWWLSKTYYKLEGAIVAGIFAGVICGIFMALIIGIYYYGGKPFIAHYLLRWRLHQADLLPFDINAFLSTQIDHIVIQKVGAHYRFVHRALQEHFADFSTEHIDAISKEIYNMKS